MPPENPIAAKLPFYDRPVLVVALAVTAVVVPLIVLGYFGILHY